MRLTFRTKLLGIVGAAAFAFSLLIVAGALIAKRVEQQLTNIQDRYVPKVELGPQLEVLFERIHRAFQDAVAARDAEALAGTGDLKTKFLEQLTAAGQVLDRADSSALRGAIEDYYSTAHDVSTRLISGETGEGLVGAMSAMQTKHNKARELLRKTTTFDRRELVEAFSAAGRAEVTAGRIRLWIGIACMGLTLMLSLALSRSTIRSLGELTAGLGRFGKSDFEHPIQVASRDEFGDVAERANQMAASLKGLGADRDRTDWLKTGQAGLAREVRGELEPNEVANRGVGFLAHYLDARAAALYYLDPDDQVLRLLGQYAHFGSELEEGAVPSFRLGEGLVGQAALQDEIAVIADPPPDYFRVRSGLGAGAARSIVLMPLLHLGKVTGVLELAFFKPGSEAMADLLLSVREILAVAIEVSRSRATTRKLLTETQQQAERLASQEEELRANNEELHAQQRELQKTNEELTHQADELEAQRRALEQKNSELDDSRRRLEQKAQELTTVSAYKSQFLANMSHELRTPLNSMLLLSNLLAENESGNLTDKQVQFAKTVHSAGKDLLALINQVLDLAKVEAGKQEVRAQDVPLAQMAEHAERIFAPLAHEKGLGFVVKIEPGLPTTITTDRQRLDQILNNLLGNALKFTERGEVVLRIGRPDPAIPIRRRGLPADQTVAFAVTDTGVGIAPEHQERVFAPFEQVEGASDRRYGGTGLGLGIAREMASLLGGELQLQSTLGKGSTFVCHLPYVGPTTRATPADALLRATSSPSAPVASPAVNTTGSPTESLLLIEDDAVFAEAFSEVIREQGFQCLTAPGGDAGLLLAKEKKPSGIILDVKLQGVDGWAVMERLQSDPDTAKIPVHFVSGVAAAERGMAMGAVGYLTKPVTRRDLIRVVESLSPRRTEHSYRVLVVEDDISAGDSLLKQLRNENIEAIRVTSAREALEALKRDRFGCMVLDLSLPDMDGLTLLESLQEILGSETPSVVVYTARALTKSEVKRLEAYTEAIVLKDGSSTERVLSEVRLFLRRLKEGLGPRSRPRTSPPVTVRLEGRKVLVVDDDMRTVYALSAALRAKGVEVFVADTGQSALDALAAHPEIEAVLMDIMMPEMDGYEAMRRVRQNPRFQKLPIIALTAKAMKGDEEICVQAGATDYLPKPIDAARLLAMLDSHLARSSVDGT